MVPGQTLRLVLVVLVNSSVARGRPRPSWVSAEALGRGGRRRSEMLGLGGWMDPSAGPSSPPSAFSLRRTRSSERVQGSHAVVEGCGANTPQSILVHWVLRGPPQGLPDDLQPLALPSGFPNPTGLHVRAEATCEQPGCRC